VPAAFAFDGKQGMPVDLDKWLRGLGLDQYGKAFREHDVDPSVLADLTESDLIGLGVTSIGHRRKLLSAIAVLKSEPAQPSASGREGDGGGERRQLTVMFCDMVGSTAMSSRLDPEEFSALLRAFQKACTEAARSFGGSVAKFMGDGALVYFGYPEAHEDDAERAIRAGLALVEAMAGFSPALRPQVRIGIATGLVVVGELIGEGSAQERVAVGETLNLAARFQSAATADSVVVGELTRRLAGAAFDYEDLGPQELKGFAGTVRLWRIVGESGARGRFDSKAGKALTSLVGRDEEIALHATALGSGEEWRGSARAALGAARLRQVSRHPGVP
jgi:class 3 adenylate cyclase